jgi:hypothetical protein
MNRYEQKKIRAMASLSVTQLGALMRQQAADRYDENRRLESLELERVTAHDRACQRWLDGCGGDKSG